MSLRTTAVSGVKWLSSSTVVVVGVQFTQTAVLSRLLSPADFGLMAMIWVIAGLAQSFTDMGMADAIVQRQDASPEQLSSVYWVTVLAGGVIGLAISLSGPLLVEIYREPALAPLAPWVGFTLFLAALGQPFQAMAQRDLHFHRIAWVETAAALMAAMAAIGAAFYGWGVYALISGGLTAATVKMGSLMAAGWRSWHPSLHFRRADLSGFLRIGMLQLGSKLANYTWSNVDYLIVGRVLGAEAVGVYRLAYEIVVRPLGTVNPIINTVAYPLFAKRQHNDESMRRGYLEVIRLLSIVVFPMLAGLIAVAPLAVPVVLGSRWLAAVPLVQILALLGIMRTVLNPTGFLLMAKGRFDTLFLSQLFLMVASPPAYWIAAPHGTWAVAWTAVLLMLGNTAVMWKAFFWDSIRLPFPDWAGAMAKAALFSGLMGCSVAVASRLLEGAAAPAVLLAVLVAVGVAVYTGLLGAFDRPYLAGLGAMLRGRGSPAGALAGDSTRLP
jgi:O-antigen/teichoic acid export membrane protein